MSEYVTRLLERLIEAPAGAAIVYYRGNLGEDAGKDPAVAALRDAVWKLHERRLVTLTQFTDEPPPPPSGSRTFEYIATRLSEAAQ